MRVVHEILLSSWQDSSDPPRRIEKVLDSGTGQAYLPIVVEDIVRDKPFNPNEEHMGSSTFGNVTPATMTGPALPPDIKIDRAGVGRVRSDGRA
jgi:hypothetical protein